MRMSIVSLVFNATKEILNYSPVFLHSYGETSWDDQVTKESLVERTIRATVHAKKTLMAGFTTVRSVICFLLVP
jgi:hypothetical protein